MSATLLQQIAFRQLPPHLKHALLALANYARPDGTGCRPSLATMALWMGRSRDRTKVAIRELRRRGLIIITQPSAQHRPTEYALALHVIETLPAGGRLPQQLPLFSGADPRFPQQTAEKAEGNHDFRRRPQALTGYRRPPEGSLATPDPCTGSVYKEISTPRAREKANAR